MKTVNNMLINLLKVLVLQLLSWLEHLTVNQRVPGSSPGEGAKLSPISYCLLDFLLFRGFL